MTTRASPSNSRSAGLSIVEESIRAIDRFLEGPPLEAGGLNLRSFLIVDRYLNLLGRTPGPGSLRRRARAALRRAALRTLPRPSLGPPIRELRRIRRYAPGRHLFVFGFPWSDRRHSVFNEGVLRALDDPASAVVVTRDPTCFETWQAQDVDAVLVEPRFRRFDPAYSLPGAWPGEAERLTGAADLLAWADRLLCELRPASVLTTQDFHLFDQAFARAGRRLGIPTLTHQHGQIPALNLSLFKYVFSERIAVWGRRSAELMERFIPKDRIWVVGTDRFDHLRSDRGPEEREHLVLALNPMGLEREVACLGTISAELRKARREPLARLHPVLKLHPSLDPADWRTQVERSGVPWEIRRDGNDELLPRTRFLITYRSTITVDAAVAGASVLELRGEEGEAGIPGFFDELSESVTSDSEVVAELQRRMAEPSLERELLARQRGSLDQEIEPGSAASREAAWLRSLEGTGG